MTEFVLDGREDVESQADTVATRSVMRWRVRSAPARRTLDGMVAATWSVHPGIRLHCVRDGCAAEAVLHTATGDAASDVTLCAVHAAAEGLVADPQRCPGGGVRLTVLTPPGETRATGITLSPAQLGDPAPPSLTLDVAAEHIEGSTVTYRDADDADLVTVSGDTIQIHHVDAAAWWQLRPGTRLPLREVSLGSQVHPVPPGVDF